MLRVALILLVALTFTAQASSPSSPTVRSVLDQIQAAYGGESINSLQSLSLDERYKTFNYTQSYSPQEYDMKTFRALVDIDFAKQKKAFRWIRGDADDFSTQHQYFSGQFGYRIYHEKQAISERTTISFHNVDWRLSLLSDTYIVKMLLDNRDAASLTGERKIKGVPHYLLTFDLEGADSLSLLFDQKSGLLSQASRKDWQPDSEFSYHYSEYNKEKGITYAERTYAVRAGKPYLLNIKRDLTFNSVSEGAFGLPKHYGKLPDMLNFEDMQAKTLDTNLYQSGRYWGFSLFYDAGEYLIGIGGYRDLQKRYEAALNQIGKIKPLKYQIVTHHHADHLGGMQDAYQLGAVFVAHPSNRARIEEAIGVPIDDNRFLFVDSEINLAEGKVKIFDFPNPHAQHQLVTFFAEPSVLFTADTYFSREHTGSPKGYPELTELASKLQSFNLEPERYAAAHSARVLTKEDMAYSLTHMAPHSQCPPKWTICP
ncbi:MBL fold metallo-hydrolase [Aestuariibacter sp. AA17]|uniref:beta-lactamase n=1 Tax=Fluctibacter corallii TaxID=2984329 RepID=A0ABT3A546_9ALTE|nr:MBL fold metallo-hydrolase [Aestuariibacter sp. AA17]MCV2883387.1 MBL fold metallo-hydrolase [Aestuariibacter sp. AA17]